MNFKDLTIIIPTYNRYELLVECVKSVRSIFADIHIIIGDSSIDIDKNLKNKFDNNIEIIDLTEYRCDIYMIFTLLIRCVKTKYVLIVEDDDKLINKEVHIKIINILKNNDISVLTFANQVIIHGNTFKYLTDCFNFNDDTIHDIPKFWNGNFLFGSTYFNTKLLLLCFNEWILQDRVRTFDGSIDESITLLAIYKSRKYIHINEVGLDIGVLHDNISWNNLMLTLYSSSTYIRDLRKSLNETYNWQKEYENILLREILTICPTISYTDVYDNTFYINLRINISTLITSNTKYILLKKILLEKLLIYQKLKKYNLLLNSYV